MDRTKHPLLKNFFFVFITPLFLTCSENANSSIAWPKIVASERQRVILSLKYFLIHYVQSDDLISVNSKRNQNTKWRISIYIV